MHIQTHTLNKNIYLRLTSSQANCFSLIASANIILKKNSNVNSTVTLKHSALFKFGMLTDMFWKNVMSQESLNGLNGRK